MTAARIWRSSIGKKFLMGISGLALVGFAVAHLAGNLTIFLGPDTINAYAEKLRHLGVLLWVARITLLGFAAVHVLMGIELARENRAARLKGYRRQKSIQTTLAAKTMALSGILILVYIVYHLLHFTFGVTHPQAAHLEDPLHRHDIYSMVVLGFQRVPVAVGYIAAMALLCLHLSHGIGSLFQSVGFNSERSRPVVERAGRLIALGLFIGYSAIPLSVLLGWLKMPGAYR